MGFSIDYSEQGWTGSGTIERSLMPGFYVVNDGRGRGHRVASQQLWRRGDRVAVVAGQITGKAGKAEPVKMYKV